MIIVIELSCCTEKKNSKDTAFFLIKQVEFCHIFLTILFCLCCGRRLYRKRVRTLIYKTAFVMRLSCFCVYVGHMHNMY